MMQDLQSVLDLFEQFEFFLIAAIVLVLAYLALEHKDIVYAVFFFGFMASFVAGFFLLLDAPYIAGMQIAVYTGGISALIIFGVLLIPRAQDSSLETFAAGRVRTIGLLVSAFVMALSGGLALAFPWPEVIPEGVAEQSQSLQGLAEWLWGEHGIYVQIIALIILTTLVGAVAILKMEKAEAFGRITGEFGIEAEPIPEPEPEPEVSETTDSPEEATN
ncbi:MAG: NADH-quinone oxidoreductase subunit J [Candidatus Thorarchaeota archaeon]|nr:NADH-quinone oxidoreductase subunit J [Candidatus Thorarchaeota archaeon]